MWSPDAAGTRNSAAGRRSLHITVGVALIDDQERHGREIGEVRLAGTIERRVGEFLEECVGFAIDDAIALLDHRAADGLGQMTFPRPWRVSYIMPIILRRSRCIPVASAVWTDVARVAAHTESARGASLLSPPR